MKNIGLYQDISSRTQGDIYVGVVGPVRTGKSTFIKLLLKELNPTEGTITVDDVKLSKLRSRSVAKYRRKIGVVF